tara:strand:- start:42 stop:215 length:174 start_codon:yes stop_codon:yes gene_type:complete
MGDKNKATKNIDAFNDGNTNFHVSQNAPAGTEKVTDPRTGEVYYREKLSTFVPVKRA